MPLKELQAAVEGLLFLAAEGPEEELFTVSAGGEEVAVANPYPNPSPTPNPSPNPNQVAVAWPEPLFPFLLVNMGSGVSVVRRAGKFSAPKGKAEAKAKAAAEQQ